MYDRGTTVGVAVVIAIAIVAGCVASSQNAPQSTGSAPGPASGSKPTPSTAAASASSSGLTPIEEDFVAHLQLDGAFIGDQSAGDEIADKVWGFYRDKRTFRAEFESIVSRPSPRHPGGHGTILFKKPKKHLWYFDDFVACAYDGSQARCYSSRSGRKAVTTDFWQEIHPVLFFLVGNLRDHYRVKLWPDHAGRFMFPSRRALVLAPKDRYAGVSIDAVNVDERTNEVWGAYMERDIEYYSYNFLQVEYDIDIPDEVFTLDALDWVERSRYVK